MLDHRAEFIKDGAISAPPVLAGAVTLFGFQLADILIMMSISWLSIQMGWWFYRRYKDWKEGVL